MHFDISLPGIIGTFLPFSVLKEKHEIALNDIVRLLIPPQ